MHCVVEVKTVRKIRISRIVGHATPVVGFTRQIGGLSYFL